MRKYWCILLLIVGFTACKDDFDEWGYVNFYIEPDTTEYYNLNEGTRCWEYFEGGNRGVIIFRNSHYEFMAYERSCVVKKCKGRLEVEEDNNVIIRCQKCGNEWLGFDGSPLSSSSATRMLYAYCAYYDGWRLYVRNCNN